MIVDKVITQGMDQVSFSHAGRRINYKRAGIIIRMLVSDIRVMGRATQGVRVIRLDEDDDITNEKILIDWEYKSVGYFLLEKK